MSGNVTLRKLLVRIGADSTEFSRKMYQSEKRFQKVSQNFNAIGRKLTLGVSLPLAAVGGVALKMAMEAQESENLFEVSMDNMAGAARKFSEDLREEFGLNAYEVRKSLGTMQAMLTSMGLGEQAAFDMSKGLAQLTYDMASFFNLEPAEAFEKLQAGITGEAEPLKRLGILVNENTIKQVAYQAGLVKTGESLTEVQKVQARYLAIMQQTSKAQGDLARTLDQPTNQLRIFKEQAKATAVEFGNSLIPFLQASLPLLKDTADFAGAAARAFAEMDPQTRKVAVGIAATLVAAGPASRVMGGLTSAAGGAAAAARYLAKHSGFAAQVLTKTADSAVTTSTASLKVASSMKKAAVAATGLKVALAGVVGVGTYQLTTYLLESTGAYEKMAEALGLGADAHKDYVEQLQQNQYTYAEQLALYNKMRSALELTGVQWEITADHTESNARKLADLLPKIIEMNRQIISQASAQRQANVATSSGVDWATRIHVELAKQAAVLGHVTEQTKDLYGVLSKNDAEQAMATLIADFKLLASEGVSAEQLMEAFGSKVTELGNVADDYAGIKFPKHFEDLAYAIQNKAVYSVDALASRLSREIPDSAEKAKTALEGSFGQGMEKATEKVTAEAGKIKKMLDDLAAGKWKVNVDLDLNSDAFRQQLGELGLKPDTAGVLP